MENADCYTCHVQDYSSARSPDHIAAKFSTDCEECHSVNSLTWNTSNVNHSFFPLTGGHSLPSCFSCHQQDTFSGLSNECYSCHQQNYQTTTNPNHITAGIPTTCEVCHSINSWSPAQFNHNITQFPLTGSHIQVDCASCHTSGYTGTPAECYTCLLYTSDAADERSSVDLGGRRIIKKKTTIRHTSSRPSIKDKAYRLNDNMTE